MGSSSSPGLILQDFVHHFHVLLPKGTNATREDIHGCLDQLDLEPDGYQVGRTMVGTLTLLVPCALVTFDGALKRFP